MYQNLGPLDMLEKFISESGSLGCAFNDTCYIRHDKTRIVEIYHSEIRIDRCEVIPGDLRLGIERGHGRFGGRAEQGDARHQVRLGLPVRAVVFGGANAVPASVELRVRTLLAS